MIDRSEKCCRNCTHAGRLNIKTMVNFRGIVKEGIDSKAKKFNEAMRVCLYEDSSICRIEDSCPNFEMMPQI